MKIYIEPRDVWVGWYRSDTCHYVCPLPCVVIRWSRRLRRDEEPNWDACGPITAGPVTAYIDPGERHRRA